NNKNVHLENDKALQFMERDEIEVLINRTINNNLEEVKTEIDKERRDFVKKLQDDQKDFYDSIKNNQSEFTVDIKNQVNNISKYNRKENIDDMSGNLNKYDREINELKTQNKNLKDRISDLENMISKMSSDMTKKNNNSNLENIPGNNYSSIKNSKDDETEVDNEDDTSIPEIPFRYVGVVEGKNMCAILEIDNKNHTVEEEEYFKGYIIKEIKPSHILLDYKGNELSLRLYE
ncbi:MAG: hypothetical protein ACOC1O_04945, partial [bacterium]